MRISISGMFVSDTQNPGISNGSPGYYGTLLSSRPPFCEQKPYADGVFSQALGFDNYLIVFKFDSETFDCLRLKRLSSAHFTIVVDIVSRHRRSEDQKIRKVKYPNGKCAYAFLPNPHHPLSFCTFQPNPHAAYLVHVCSVTSVRSSESCLRDTGLRLPDRGRRSTVARWTWRHAAPAYAPPT